MLNAEEKDKQLLYQVRVTVLIVRFKNSDWVPLVKYVSKNLKFWPSFWIRKRTFGASHFPLPILRMEWQLIISLVRKAKAAFLLLVPTSSASIILRHKDGMGKREWRKYEIWTLWCIFYIITGVLQEVTSLWLNRHFTIYWVPRWKIKEEDETYIQTVEYIL